MNRLFKTVVAALVALLTAQPALAGLTCGMMPMAAGTHECEMAMSAMGEDCPMHHSQSAGTGCLQECCRNGWPQALVQLPSKAKPKSGGMQFPVAVLRAAVDAHSSQATAPLEEIAAASPPRHVLLKVFRI
jgi:hypothetical protein